MTHDPFSIGDDDRTVLRPKTAPRANERVYDNAQATTDFNPTAIDAIPLLGGINPLEKAASRLITTVMVLRKASAIPDTEYLRQQLIQEVDQFKHRAREILPDSTQAVQASYVMCSFVDEAAMNTPWGTQANWSQHNLLATFHNEVGGGERFFSLLKSLAENPKKNKQLLEFMYLLLTLGYEGAYRITSDGQQTLIKVRNWLYNILNSNREPAPVALSAQWQGSNIKERRMPRATPLWVALAAALAISSATYLYYRMTLVKSSDQLTTRLWSLDVNPLTVRAVVPPARPQIKIQDDVRLSDSAADQITLTKLLADEISLGVVEVDETFDRGIIRLTGDDLFQSGKTKLGASYASVVGQIGAAVNQIKGDVVVTGHTDNIPIRSAKFPSNTELSKARANAVGDLLQLSLNDPARMITEGRGSLEAIASNDTAAGRARNRRVEITVFY